MKKYKNLEELNKEWAAFGFQVNEKGEVLAFHEGKEYKVGQININGKISEKEIRERERERVKTNI